VTKYPLDNKAIENIANDLIRNHQAQDKLISLLSEHLKIAVAYIQRDGRNGEEWVQEADKLLKEMDIRAKDFDNLRFDQQNGHKDGVVSPYEVVNDASTPIDMLDSLNTSMGPETPMTEEELARHFGEKLPTKKVEMSVSDMTLEEINEWEAKQNNNNDIYKVAARVKNLARGSKATLTPVGESLCNVFVHVLKTFYDFAETIQDKDVRAKLIELVRTQEAMPGNFIEATHAGVKG
jgi:hypothetical protein